jgi:ring-1,2-phenylacetyl-CoA epoxidase subunit PaaD
VLQPAGPVALALGPTRTLDPGPAPAPDPVRCPHCGSADTELLSRFSSTACKALRRCLACREPFDHFKEL